MKIKILSLFPELFERFLSTSIIGRAQDKKIIEIENYNLRDWATDKHRQVDDKPYGGGAGMVLKADIIDNALTKLKTSKSKVILLTPQGKTYNQNLARSLSKQDELILICGRYEGFDERVKKLVDMKISIGDYILTGGEIPAMVIIDSISRLIPGVVGKKASIVEESFSSKNLLDYPEYTAPRSFKPKSKPTLNQLKVPKVLLSGDHKKIDNWRNLKKKSK